MLKTYLNFILNHSTTSGVTGAIAAWTHIKHLGNIEIISRQSVGNQTKTSSHTD